MRSTGSFSSLVECRWYRSSLSGAPHHSRQTCSKARYEAKEAAIDVRRQRHDISCYGGANDAPQRFPASTTDLMSSLELGCDATTFEKLEKIAKPNRCLP